MAVTVVGLGALLSLASGKLPSHYLEVGLARQIRYKLERTSLA